MRVSILHWNRPNECLKTVKSFQAQHVQLEITVIDNGSSQENLALLKSTLPDGAEVICLPENLGWGAAHNVVIQRWLNEESSENCLISAHDALLEANCVSMLLQAMSENPDWGMVCPEYGIPELPDYSHARGTRMVPVASREPGVQESVQFCLGTVAMLRRECIQRIGSFSEKYFVYGDETEIGLRAVRLGWKVGLVWGAVVHNPETSSNPNFLAYFFARNSLLLAKDIGGNSALLCRTAVLLISIVKNELFDQKLATHWPAGWRLKGIFDYFQGYTGGPPKGIC